MNNEKGSFIVLRLLLLFQMQMPGKVSNAGYIVTGLTGKEIDSTNLTDKE